MVLGTPSPFLKWKLAILSVLSTLCHCDTCSDQSCRWRSPNWTHQTFSRLGRSETSIVYCSNLFLYMPLHVYSFMAVSQGYGISHSEALDRLIYHHHHHTWAVGVWLFLSKVKGSCSSSAWMPCGSRQSVFPIAVTFCLLCTSCEAVMSSSIK